MANNNIFTEIIINNIQRERATFSRHACKSHIGIRKFPEMEKVADRINIRPVFFHDTDKIIHSSAYTRYIDKTQVFCLFENDHITHRVLHVQLVSKIGRVIGRCLRLNEDLIEAIALGHDLGHVPYGHDGENILHELCKDNGIGCFYHNVQSVRLLMQIEGNGRGLNLSLQVLDGILAHNGEMPSNKYEPTYDKNWDSFEEEYKKCCEIENYSEKIIPMTLEGCVVRISDLIAYLGRDIEDAIRLKVIKRTDIPREIRRVLGFPNDKIINNLVLDLLKNSYGKSYLSFSDDVFRALNELLGFNIEFIYKNASINTELPKIKNMFTQLFERYCQDLAANYQDSDIYDFIHEKDDVYLQNTNDRRMVCDYVAGMTDVFFNNRYQNLFVPQSYGYSL